MKKTATAVQASYEILAVYDKVLLRVPALTDPHMKFLPSHGILVDGKNINVASHYRRGDKFGDKFVTKNYYLDRDMTGKNIVATVKVVGKTDMFKAEVSLILDIYPDLSGSLPEFRLKVGSPLGDFSIPSDPTKYIRFQEI